MCGRATLISPVEDIAEAFGVAPIPIGPPRFNVAPSQDLAIVRALPDRSRELVLARWGLGGRSIQARGETLPRAPAFRDAFKSKRCLVVVDGFYEWSGPKKTPGRQAHHIRLPSGGPFAIAGVWDSWKTPQGAIVATCAVVTTSSRGSATLGPLHDRMPLVLDGEARERWLTASPEDARVLLAQGGATSSSALLVIPVSSWVNDARHDDARCLEPVVPTAAAAPVAPVAPRQTTLRFE